MLGCSLFQLQCVAGEAYALKLEKVTFKQHSTQNLCVLLCLDVAFFSFSA